MACLLTKGRGLPCKSGVGGLKAVYFVDYGGLGALTKYWWRSISFWLEVQRL